mgnify:CR=1 FL=1
MKRRINILCLIALLLSFVLPYTPAAAKAPAMKRRLTLTAGQKTTLKISGGIIRKKSFKSSKKSIVSVTSKGKLTAKKAGQCKITATIQWKPKKSFRKFFKKKLYCKVTVQNNLLMEHFLKHGAEFPYSSAAEYLRGANRVIKDQNALHKAEAEDGDDVYYLAAANEIVFVSTDGYIRTYFKPNDGIDYFNRT